MESEIAVARSGNWVRRLIKVNENEAARSRTWVRKLGKVVAAVSIALMALYLVASVAWRFSGSNQWEFAGERNGVKIYTLKAPGSDLIQVRGVVRIQSTLGGFMKLLLEPDTTGDYGYQGQRTIERVDEWLEYSSLQLDLPFPFQTREFVVRNQVHQDPRTKELLLVVAAAPDKAPPDDCCLRVSEMNNTLRLIPLGNGQIEAQYTNNTNMGGFMPALLLNIERPKFVAEVLLKFQELLDKRKFRDAKVDFIEEK